MGEIRSHRDLVAWQRARQLGLALYRVTSGFPSEERYGLTNQLRRAGVSIASNIAEGYGRGTRQDYLRFLRMARGSVYEVDTQLCFADDLGYLTGEEHRRIQDLTDECGRLIAGLIRSIEHHDNHRPGPSA